MKNQKLNFRIVCANCDAELTLITTNRLKDSGFEAQVKIQVEPCKNCTPEDIYVDLFVNDKKEEQFVLARP